jgi:hypothetical protein
VAGNDRSIADPHGRARREIVLLADSVKGDVHLVATAAVSGEFITKYSDWEKKESII